MIVFELVCDIEHRFEGWFASAEDFDGQKRDGLLACPVCGSAAVRKLLTAKIGRSERVMDKTPAAMPVSLAADKPDLSAVIDHILLSTEDVGPDFAREARLMHRGERSDRAIRGQASAADTESLLDEGIPVFSLPIPAKSGWN
jgi:hypothetical protein